MNLSQYLKPAGTVVFVVALGVGYYLFEHRKRPEPKETQSEALVIVTKSTNACFSDLVRVTGFFVPRREAVVIADQEGSKVTDLLVTEGAIVADNQELARLTAPPQIPGQPQRPGPQGPISLKAPAPGLVTEVRTIVGAPASPQAGPMFRIAVNNEIELDAQVPAVHMAKLSSGATSSISLLTAMRNIGPACGEAGAPTMVRTSVTRPGAGAFSEIGPCGPGRCGWPGICGGGVRRASS